MKFNKKNIKICILGLGYVGLPLALKLSEKFKVTGFDINPKRISQLKNGYDITSEFTTRDLLKKKIFIQIIPMKLKAAISLSLRSQHM